MMTTVRTVMTVMVMTVLLLQHWPALTEQMCGLGTEMSASHAQTN